MKNYTYTARDASGALQRGNLEAVDRTTALAIIRSKGLVPLSVAEGGAAVRMPKRLDVATKRVLFATLCVAAIVAGVISLFLQRPSTRPSTSQEKPTQKETIRITPPQSQRTQTELQTPVVPKQEVIEDPVTDAQPVIEQPQPVREISRTASQSREKKPPRILKPGIRSGDTNAPNPYATFKTRTERMLSMMLTAKPGNVMLDLGTARDMDSDFKAALENQIEIYATASAEMATHKEDVAYLKEEMRKMVAAGQSPTEILETFRQKHNEIAAARNEYQRQLSELKKAGKWDEAEEFAKEANKLLEPYHTRPLTVYPSIPKRQQ